MADMMMFPSTVEEFMEQYKITDTEHIYTNGADLVHIFRMKQWFEHAAPEQKHGIWLSSVDDKIPARLDENGNPDESCWCSACGEWLVASDEYPVRGRYCPSCGARMDGTEPPKEEET